MSRVSYASAHSWITRVLAFVGLLVFLSTSFRAGWLRTETDFPNYYTAAVLVRRGQPLRKYYDWTWFQEQMNYAGIENQLGAYVPQTPVTMFPILPMAGFRVQTAKRIWLVCNIAFLAASIFLLSRITRFSIAEISLLTFAGFGTLYRNFLLGQYYVFLLFVLVLGFYLLMRARTYSAGVAFGSACALKLYGVPLLLYFAIRRERRPLIGLIAAMFCFLFTAAAIFGSRDILFFVTHILPRAVQGETIDPYNPGNDTIPTLLRRTFVPEAELNPHPVWNAPVIFFFLQPLLTLWLISFPLLGVRRSSSIKRDFAWFFVALLLVSPNTASYTFVLLLLPIALLLDEATRTERVILIGAYVFLATPLPGRWSFLFPKVWLLLLLYGLVARHYRAFLSTEAALKLSVLLIIIALVLARDRIADYSQETPQRWEHLVVEPHAIFSSSPAVIRSGIVYQSIWNLRYVLRWLHGGHIETFAFDGQAIRPRPAYDSTAVEFELLSHGSSERAAFDPHTRKVLRLFPAVEPQVSTRSISMDTKCLVFTRDIAGSTQIFLMPSGGVKAFQLTKGNCNNFSPAWELDSKSVIFASDCGRGIGLPALYRAHVGGSCEIR